MSGRIDSGWVSVVIPTYNRAQVLLEALESVRAQTYRPIEIIIVDDGSTDSTIAAIDSWAGSAGSSNWRVTVIRQSNKGAPAARNHGLSCARGEFVQYLDSDDTLGPSKIAAQVSSLSRHPEWDVVAGNSYELETGCLAEPCEPLTRAIGLMRCITSWTLPVNNPLFTRRACDLLGRWNENMRCFEDASYMAGIFCLGLNLGYVSGAPSYIRGHHSPAASAHGPRVSFRGEPSRLREEVLALYWHHRSIFSRFPPALRNVEPYASALSKEGFRVARKLMRLGDAKLAEELLAFYDDFPIAPRLRFDRASLRILGNLVGKTRAASWHEQTYDWLHSLRLSP